MGDFLKAIQNTPIPTILIVVGLFIIVLAFVVKIGGVIEVAPEQRRWAIPIGLFVLIIGLVLNFASPGRTLIGETPAGRYTDTCPTRDVKGDILYAVCKRIDGTPNSTSLPGFKDCKTTIDNTDGVLGCQK